MEVKPPEVDTLRAAILKLLVEARSERGPVPKIAACAAAYNGRIHELRHSGYNINNRTEEIAVVRHSWFCLEVPSSFPTTLPLFTEGGR